MDRSIKLIHLPPSLQDAARIRLVLPSRRMDAVGEVPPLIQFQPILSLSARHPQFVALALLTLLLSVPGLSLAAAGWDCQPAKNGSEWVCVAGKPKPATAEKPVEKPTPQPEGSAPAEEPSQAGTVKSQPPAAEPAPQRAESPGRERPEDRSEPAVAQPQPMEEPAKPAQEPQRATAEREPPRNPQTPEQAEAYHQQALQKPENPTPDEGGRVATAQEAAPAGGPPGWNCKAGGKEWNCSLVGPDPRGMAHRAEGNGDEGWAESSTITAQDEARFRNIMAKLPKDPWSLACGWHKTEYTRPRDFLLSSDERGVREKTPLEIHSNYAEMLRNEIADFKGQADLARADQRLYGDFVSHNSEAETLTANGNVVYQEKGLAFSSDTAFLRMKTNEGVLRNAQFLLQTVPSRGTARVVHLDSKDVTRYDTLSYTTCPPGNQDWMMHSSSTRIDRSTGRGVAKNAWLEFKGVPFLYTPIMTFPTDDRRQTGFLTPTFASTKVGGFDLSVPYYINIAPNYDATLTPRLLTNRGPMLRSEFRYLGDQTFGRFGAEYMPNDSKRGGARGSFVIENRTNFTERLHSNADINWVSDKRYLNELGNVLSFPVNRNISSKADLKYAGHNYSVEARGDYYETIDTTIFSRNRPYRRLPQILGKFDDEIAETGLRFQGRTDLAVFDHPRSDLRVTGQRFNLRPRLSYPFARAGGYITPSIAFDYTQYWLDWPNAQKAGRSDSISRSAPIFSVDSGAFFEREFDWGSSPMQQTLEPRLFYLYIPKVNQDRIPIFDTGVYDFNFYQLFRENRFAGGDRLGDANQFTAALTSRFVDRSNGLERFRASIGEIYYFRNPAVTLPCDQDLTANQTLTDWQLGVGKISPSVNCNGNRPVPNTQDKSNLVGEFASQLSEDWSVRTIGQWNPDAGRIDRGQVGLQYNNKANQLLNLGYRYRRDPITGDEVVQQTDASFRLPIADGWFLSGRWQYSILNQVTVETFLGIERETCCWRFSLIGSRFLNGALSKGGDTSNSATTNNAVFVQLELKGLTRFGDQVDQFFSRTLSGFRGPREVFGTNPYQQQ